MKKIKISSEVCYAAALLLISFSVAMLTAANFGVSMIVAPAYIISQKLGFVTFGQSEYIVQGTLFIVFCLLMKRVRLIYFSSFITGLIYGALLDFWRTVIPQFNPHLTVPGSMALWVRIVYFLVGMTATSLSVALFFKKYFYPQVYDFFVKGVSARYGLNRDKFKICFDITCLAVSCALTLLLFHRFVGVGIGTLIMTACNGLLIAFFSRQLDRFIDFEPLAENFSRRFALA